MIFTICNIVSYVFFKLFKMWGEILLPSLPLNRSATVSCMHNSLFKIHTLFSCGIFLKSKKKPIEKTYKLAPHPTRHYNGWSHHRQALKRCTAGLRCTGTFHSGKGGDSLFHPRNRGNPMQRCSVLVRLHNYH